MYATGCRAHPAAAIETLSSRKKERMTRMRAIRLRFDKR